MLKGITKISVLSIIFLALVACEDERFSVVQDENRLLKRELAEQRQTVSALAERVATKFLAENSYKTMNRGLLEMTFFFSPTSATDILSNPAASVSTIIKMFDWFKATGQLLLPETEFTEEHFGVTDKSNKKFVKKTANLVPVIGSWTDIFNIFDKKVN